MKRLPKQFTIDGLPFFHPPIQEHHTVFDPFHQGRALIENRMDIVSEEPPWLMSVFRAREGRGRLAPGSGDDRRNVKAPPIHDNATAFSDDL